MAFSLGILVGLLVLLAVYLWRRLRRAERELADWRDEHMTADVSPQEAARIARLINDAGARRHERIRRGVGSASQTATGAAIMANEARLKLYGH